MVGMGLHLTEKQNIGSTGYYMVSFSYRNCSKPKRVHRLLAATFIPNPYNKPHINHKDGNKLNNSLVNLEWVTNQENATHANINGLINNTGEKNGMCKLTAEKVRRIKSMLKDGVSQYKIAAMVGGISRSAILKIKLGKSWRHVSL